MATTKAIGINLSRKSTQRNQRKLVERMEDACDRFDMMLTELKDLGKPTYSLAEARQRLDLPPAALADGAKAK